MDVSKELFTDLVVAKILMLPELLMLNLTVAKEMNPELLENKNFNLEHAEKLAEDNVKSYRESLRMVGRRILDVANNTDFSDGFDAIVKSRMEDKE